MARLYQKINNEAVPLGGGGGGSVAIDNDTITENSDGEIQVATTLTSKINQLNNSAADMGKVLTANGNGTAEWDDILVPIDYETITKNSNGELQVSSVPYDNTESGLTADNVQDAIDEVSSDLTASDGLNFRFATDGEGNYGYLKGDDTFVPFKIGGSEVYVEENISTGASTIARTLSFSPTFVAIFNNNWINAAAQYKFCATWFGGKSYENLYGSSDNFWRTNTLTVSGNKISYKPYAAGFGTGVKIVAFKLN